MVKVNEDTEILFRVPLHANCVRYSVVFVMSLGLNLDPRRSDVEYIYASSIWLSDSRLELRPLRNMAMKDNT